MTGLRVTALTDESKGYWTARVHHGGQIYECTREFGSWMASENCELVKWAAAELQQRVRKIERARQREA